MRKLKMAILGLGPIAQTVHLAALTKAHNVDLIAACDVAPDVLEPVAARYAISRTYSAADQLWVDRDVEAVLIAVADPFHAPLCIAAMRAGKHVLVEKPLAATVGECEEIVTVARETNRQLQVGFMKRHDPALQAAQQFASDQMGRHIAVSGWYCDSAFHTRYIETLSLPWIASPAQKRPDRQIDPMMRMLLGHGVHAIDLLRFFGGDIVAVSAQGRRFENAQSSLSLLEYASGATGTLNLIDAVRMDWFEGLHIHGEHGSVVARIPFPYALQHADVRIYDDRTGEYRTASDPDSDPYERQVEAFADAILGGRPVSPSAEDGLAAERVLYAIAESQSTNGRRIEI
jgi:predicted dehydrogenase